MGLVLPAALALGPAAPGASFASVVLYELKLATRVNLSVSLAGEQAQGTWPPRLGSSARKVWKVG